MVSGTSSTHITSNIQNAINEFASDIYNSSRYGTGIISSSEIQSDLKDLVENIMDQIYNQLIKVINDKKTAENNFLMDFWINGVTSVTNNNENEEKEYGYGGDEEKPYIMNKISSYISNISNLSGYLK